VKSKQGLGHAGYASRSATNAVTDLAKHLYHAALIPATLTSRVVKRGEKLKRPWSISTTTQPPFSLNYCSFTNIIVLYCIGVKKLNIPTCSTGCGHESDEHAGVLCSRLLRALRRATTHQAAVILSCCSREPRPGRETRRTGRMEDE
jgi:hypothetical protein